MSNPYIAEIRLFAGNFAPSGWAFCDGRLLPIDQYQALFALVGTTYGGDGANTFGLPDLRSRVPVGTGQGAGLSNVIIGERAGTETVTLLTNNLPAHTHAVKANSDTNGMTANVTGNYLNGKTEAEESVTSTGPALTQLNAATVGLTGGSQPINITPPLLGISYIISLFGIFPTSN